MRKIVIKCGGSILEQLPETFFENIVTLVNDYHVEPVIVHGGGPMVTSLLEKLGVETSFVDGLRVTTSEVLDVAEMVLTGAANKQLVGKIHINGGSAIGLSGVDGKLLVACPLNGEQKLGFVGEVESVNSNLLKTILDHGQIPVISPIGADNDGQRWNINGDLAAAAIAEALSADLYMITNVSGVLKQGEVIPHLNASEVTSMIEDGEIYGGMIPKVQAAIDCLQQGIEHVTILNGLEKDALIHLAKGEKKGTSFALDEAKKIAY